MLTNQLRELEEDGLIIHTVYSQVSSKVKYQLSELGKSLEPILLALKQWGDTHIGLYGKLHPQDMIDENVELETS